MRTVTYTTAGLAGLAFLIIGSAGCQGADLGRYCFVGADTNSNAGQTIQILNTEAPECSTRLCLKQKGYGCLDGANSCDNDVTQQFTPRPVCSNKCKSHGDCGKGGQNVNECKSYVCQAQGPETGFGGQCICVCLDYIRDDNGNELTKEAFDQTSDSCVNQ